MWWYGNGMGVGGFVIMALSTLAVWALIAVLIIALVRGLARGHTPPSGPDRGAGPSAAGPEAILAERYARGEISEREYSERLSVLRNGPQAPTRAG